MPELIRRIENTKPSQNEQLYTSDLDTYQQVLHLQKARHWAQGADQMQGLVLNVRKEKYI